MTRRHAWLTPDDAPGDPVCFRVYSPGGDDYEAALRGALALLVDPENWEETGAQTPEICAQSFLDAMFLSYRWDRCMPIGAIFWLAHSTIPSNCLLCDGSIYLRSDYPLLFDEIGHVFGPYLDQMLQISPSDMLAFWPLNEPSGSVANDISGNDRDGVNTNVTPGAPGIGDGETAYSYDGVSDSVDIYSTSLRDAFNGDEGTLILWAKVSSGGIWTDGVYHWCVNIGVNANNRIVIMKTPVNNRLEFRYQAGGVNKAIQHNAMSSTEWLCLALTWSKSADEMKAYIDGEQYGSTLTGLGTWSGVLVNSECQIGSKDWGRSYSWNGSIGRVLLWEVALAAEDIASAYSFAVPDLRGAAPVGIGAGAFGGDYQVGDTGGEIEHELAVSELPAHSHSQPTHTHTIAPHTHPTTVGTVPILAAPGAVPADGPSIPGATGPDAGQSTASGGDDETGSVGGTTAHNNMMPYLALVPVIVAS